MGVTETELRMPNNMATILLVLQNLDDATFVTDTLRLVPAS